MLDDERFGVHLHSIAQRRSTVTRTRQAARLDRRLLLMLVFFAALVPVGLGRCAYAAVTPLPVPSGMTIDPEAPANIMAGAGRTIAAISYELGSGEAGGKALLRWSPGGLEVFRPPMPPPKGEYKKGAAFELAGVRSDGTIAVNALYVFSGAYTGVNVYPMLLRNLHFSAVAVPDCDAVAPSKPSSYVPHITGISSNSMLVTFFSPQLLTADVEDTGSYGPYAAIVSRAGCEVLGQGYVLSRRGTYSAGWRGYHGNTGASLTGLTPDYVLGQRLVALRWQGTVAAELGQGITSDVTADGVCVGAADITESLSLYGLRSAAATMWPKHGAPVSLAPNADFSVAHAINSKHWVVGMLRDHTRHYAFLWIDGRTRKLDDVLTAPNWQFEAAFGFVTPNRVFGIGRFRGVPTAFLADLPQSVP